MRCSDRCVFAKRPFGGCLSFDLNQNQISSAKMILAHPKVCGDTASYVGNIWLWFFSTYAVSVEPFQCNVLFLCVFVVSFFPLFPSLPHPPSEQHPVPYRQKGEPGSFQFGRAHDHVSFSCAIPTHPISKTTSQFHQPYSYSIPPLQRSAGRPGRPGWRPPAESGGSALRLPLTGLSGALCHPRHLA